MFPHKLLWKVDMVLRSQSGWIICVAETGARYKIKPIVFEVCTRDLVSFAAVIRVVTRHATLLPTKWGGALRDE